MGLFDYFKPKPKVIFVRVEEAHEYLTYGFDLRLKEYNTSQLKHTEEAIEGNVPCTHGD